MPPQPEEPVGVEIDPAELRAATAAALAMLARRDYSAAALTQKLARKGYSETVVSAVCARCIDSGYLDDRRYGRERLEAWLERRPSGRRAAVDDLRHQGLTATMSESIVEEVFAEAGGEEAVLATALRRWRARHGEVADLSSAKRCFDHLMRRRFPRYLVLQALSPRLDDLTG